MGKEKKSFVFNIDWRDVLMDYPAEVRYEVYDAIIEYAASGKLTELRPLAKMAFSFIKKEIDYNRQKYAEKVEKCSEAGKKGMASRYGRKKGTTSVTDDNKTNVSYQPVTNLTDNVYVNDDDNKKPSTDVDVKKDPPSSSPSTLDEEIETMKGDMCWLDQLQVLHHMDTGMLKARLDEFRLQCAADGKERHRSLSDAKSHFNSWLRVTAEKQRSYGNENRNAYTGKQEANEYALQQYLADRAALERGVYGPSEDPF